MCLYAVYHIYGSFLRELQEKFLEKCSWLDWWWCYIFHTHQNSGWVKVNMLKTFCTLSTLCWWHYTHIHAISFSEKGLKRKRKDNCIGCWLSRCWSVSGPHWSSGNLDLCFDEKKLLLSQCVFENFVNWHQHTGYNLQNPRKQQGRWLSNEFSRTALSSQAAKQAVLSVSLSFKTKATQETLPAFLHLCSS